MQGWRSGVDATGRINHTERSRRARGYRKVQSKRRARGQEGCCNAPRICAWDSRDRAHTRGAARASSERAHARSQTARARARFMRGSECGHPHPAWARQCRQLHAPLECAPSYVSPELLIKILVNQNDCYCFTKSLKRLCLKRVKSLDSKDILCSKTYLNPAQGRGTEVGMHFLGTSSCPLLIWPSGPRALELTPPQ